MRKNQSLRSMESGLDEPQSVVVAALEQHNDEDDFETSLREIEGLTETANGVVVAVVTQKRSAVDPRTYFGKGKVEEIKEVLERANAELLVVDGEISPTHQRNLERELEAQVIDRTGLILDIFARRAQTSEGKLQVELAQLEYLLPRLTNMWSHLERIRGGIGLKGPGETQIETDRRLVRNKIALLKGRVNEIRERREVQRSKRSKSNIPIVSIVGYTNAGKSTLLSTLSGDSIFAEDKLFATLDPTTRDVTFEGGTRCLISDTVGFIKNLPTQLVAAFRATLEEVNSADILLHVIDATNSAWEEQMSTVEKILGELKANDKPTIIAFNKVDDLEEDEFLRLKNYTSRYENVVYISAKANVNMDKLEGKIVELLKKDWETVDILLPHNAGKLITEIHSKGKISVEEYTESGVHIQADVPKELANRLLRA